MINKVGKVYFPGTGLFSRGGHVSALSFYKKWKIKDNMIISYNEEGNVIRIPLDNVLWIEELEKAENDD